MWNQNKDFRKAQGAAKRKLAELRLPEVLDLETLVEIVSAYRGIPVRVRLMPEGVDPLVTGLTVVNDSMFIVCHCASPNPHRSDVVVCHELAHLFFKHDVDTPDSEVPASVLAMCPDLDASTVARVMHRRVFNDPKEREAEALADLLALKLTRAGVKSGREPDAFDEVFG